MNEHQPSGTRRRRGVVAAILSAAAVAVALPVSGALAGGDPASGESASRAAVPTQARDQTAPRDDAPRERGDCPEKDGRGDSGSDSSSGSDASVEL